MIQVRDTFQVKFGKINQAVDHFRAFRQEIVPEVDPRTKTELVTDLSGTMFMLTTGWQLDSLAA